MQPLGHLPNQSTESDNLIKDLSKGVARGLFESFSEMLSPTAKVGAKILNILMADVYIPNQSNPMEGHMANASIFFCVRDVSVIYL